MSNLLILSQLFSIVKEIDKVEVLHMYTPIPIKRSTRYGNNYWEAYSPKMNRNIRLFSDLEYDHWILTETDHRIQSFCEQPLRIQTSYNGKPVESIFDMWIMYKGGHECFVEVKYTKDLDPANPRSNRALQQTAVQKSWCQEHNYTHTIRTELDIRNNGIYLSNMKQLLGYIKNRKRPIELDQFQVMEFLKKGRTSLSEIEQSTRLQTSRIREAVFWLIYEGIVESDMNNRLIGPLTEVWIFNGQQTVN
jgi:hypothetical protein